MTKGKKSEYDAVKLLEGYAYVTNLPGADISWTSLLQRKEKVEVKAIYLKKDDIGKKVTVAGFRKNQIEDLYYFDYCMFMVYIDENLERAYLIPRCDIQRQRWLTLPKDWERFKHAKRIHYARLDHSKRENGFMVT